MRRAFARVQLHGALAIVALLSASPVSADALQATQPDLVLNPECDIRRASGLIQNAMGFYLLEFATAAPGKPGYSDSELTKRLVGKAPSLAYLLLARQMFGKQTGKVLNGEKELNAVIEDEMVGLRAQLANVRRGDVNAFYAADSRWSTRYTHRCHAAKGSATP